MPDSDRNDLPEVIPPKNRGLFYGGKWHEAKSGATFPLFSPSTGEGLGEVAEAQAEDVDAAVAEARKGFEEWRRVPPLERAKLLREIAAIMRRHGDELAMLDAADCGNPYQEMRRDALIAAAGLDYFAGLVLELKGETIPMGEGTLNYSVREPLGVVARIIPFNHPVMFAGMRSAAPLAAGNAIIIKPPEQAPLSTMRLAELVEDLLPAGVFNVLPGGKDCGAALSTHPGVDKVALIGSVPTGKAVMKAAADSIKPVLLELGGKNAFIACEDTDVEKAAKAAIDGMNFTWCGQSCGSTSRCFIHESIYDEMIELMKQRAAYFKPGIPMRPDTTMGAIINEAQMNRVLDYIESAKQEGATLLTGGKRPEDPELANGFFVEPTIFTDVTPKMRVASEEIFGPVLSVFKWRDEAEMMKQVNAVDYGLTAAIWTRDLARAHRLAAQVQVGYVWINNVSLHFIGANFGGYKQSGLGREEGLEELLAFSQSKNVNVVLEP